MTRVTLALLAFLAAGCHRRGLDQTLADVASGRLCVADSASVCTALGGAHECTDGAGQICVLCWPVQRDQCPLDGVTSGEIAGGDAVHRYVCVLDCNECAQDPREVALGIKCDASPPPTAPPPGQLDLSQ